MLKDLYTFATQLFSLTRKTQQHEEDIKALRQELRAVVEALHNQKFEQQRDRDNAAHQQAALILRLENTLLRFDRSLPSAPQGTTELEALRSQVEALTQENAALRQRISELD